MSKKAKEKLALEELGLPSLDLRLFVRFVYAWLPQMFWILARAHPSRSSRKT
jgi:hypothetical protein